MFARITRWAILHPGMALALTLGVVLAGIGGFRGLRVDAFPDLTDVQVQVLVDVPGLAPVEVERLVSFPIEVSLGGLPDVKQVRSLSKYAFAAMTVVFEDGTDIHFARALVNERLQAARTALPPGAEAVLGPLSGASSEVYAYTIEGGGLDPMELRTLHDRVVRPQLRAVPGVTEINAFGGFVRQVQIVVRPEQLVRFGLTLHDIVETVSVNSAIAAGGYLEHNDEQFILRGLGQASSLRDLYETVIRSSTDGVPVLLGDVAEIGFGPELIGFNDRRGTRCLVSGIVMMLRGENSRQVVRRVAERVEEINAALPDGVVVAPYYDQSDLVHGTLRTVRANLIEGGFLVIAVLLVFLGNLRAALIVAAVIPLSLLFAVIGMRWLGLSANLMSLGAIDFGMIVDGAVVMAEQFVRGLHHDSELPFRRRLMLLARAVVRPIAFGVLIILLVYLPILALTGLEGRMFRPMAMTVMLALFGSLLLALIFVPAATAVAFRKGRATESRFALRLSERLDHWYTPALSGAMSHPGRMLTIVLLLLAAAGFVAPRLGSEFLPELDEGSILIEATRDPSVALTASIAMQEGMERVIRETPEISTVVSRTGRPDIGSDPMGVNRADVFVMLNPRSTWRPGVTKDSIVRELEANLQERVPGIAYGFTQPVAMRLNELISGVRADLAVKIFGDSTPATRAIAEAIGRVIGSIEGTAEVAVEQTTGQGYLNVRLDRARMARFGIPVHEVQEALETAVAGRPVAAMLDGNWTLDITVQYPHELRSSPEAIGSITIPTPSGARIALRQLAEIAIESGPVQISREAAQRLVTVQANVDGRDLGGYAREVRETIEREVKLPPGVFLRYGGQFENQERAMARLGAVVPVSILVIAGLLYAALGSWALALLVLVNLPVAAVGVVMALLIRDLHLGVSAAIGFIALFGVAVLNGLVLLSTMEERRRSGESAERAAREGARQRLRPVLMTAMVASIGFLPVALSHGTGAEVQRPLATVVIGGLITSTLLTLFVLPTWYPRIRRAIVSPVERRDDTAV
ncbi:MAG TPA: CusA/CzcA family heavy metal efflux RND transporter [Gemmatimonadales bacterium]|nr:CusA/CzcA family heavy metal efflux RND transporter [Gemmatimonadales bacterium]